MNYIKKNSIGIWLLQTRKKFTLFDNIGLKSVLAGQSNFSDSKSYSQFCE